MTGSAALAGAVVGTGLLSLVLAVGSALLALLFITRMPCDYFSCDSPSPPTVSARRPTVALAVRLCRNTVGLALTVAGIAMLVLPGQGLLTILLGLMLLEFPGKRRLEAALVSRPAVLDSLNWLRRLVRQPPLEHPERGVGVP